LIGGELQHSNIFTVEVSGVNDKAMEKTIKVIGGGRSNVGR